MSHYKSNVRDIKFNLFEVLGLGEVLEAGHFGDLDTETAHNILDEVARLAEGPIAESFVHADRDPVVFDVTNHEVRVPDPLRKSVLALKEAGWWRLGLPEELGGLPAPSPLVWAVREMLCAANSSARFYEMGPQMAEVLFEVGTPLQKHWAAAGMERGWAGTMVLTEPDAGSDVGAGRTKATPQDDGTWHISGVKRFISGAEVGDTAENVFHLVLARPVGAGAGTKGPSACSMYRSTTSTRRLWSWESAMAFSSPGWNTKWVSSPHRPANSHSEAPTCPRSAGWSAKSTTASLRYSR